MSSEEEELHVNEFRKLTKLQQIDVCECLFTTFLDDMIASDVTSVEECIQNIITMYSSSPNRFFVFYKQNELVAFASVDVSQLSQIVFFDMPLSIYPCLSNLYVSPSYRKQGIAQAVIQFVCYYLQQKIPNCHDLFLWCEKSLIPFYQHLGGSMVLTNSSKHYMKISF